MKWRSHCHPHAPLTSAAATSPGGAALHPNPRQLRRIQIPSQRSNPGLIFASLVEIGPQRPLWCSGQVRLLTGSQAPPSLSHSELGLCPTAAHCLDFAGCIPAPGLSVTYVPRSSLASSSSGATTPQAVYFHQEGVARGHLPSYGPRMHTNS